MRTLKALKFVVMAPFLVAFLALINVMTWNGEWWVQWAALGIGIAWVFSVLRLIRAVILAGGLAALGAILLNRNR